VRLDLGVAALVLLSALIHASWNALLKSERDRLGFFALVLLAGVAMAALALPFVPSLPSRAWPWLAASVTIHNVYYVFLLRGYAHGDLSHVYPIARGLSPLLVSLLSGAVAGEHLSALELAGAGFVSLGVASVALAGGVPRGAAWWPTTYAVASGVTIASYTLADGVGARVAGSPLSYVVWLNLFSGVWLVVAVAWRRRNSIDAYLRRHWIRGAGAGAIATVGYAIAVWALSRGALAHVAALRETSVIFAALIGATFLGEPLGRVRVGAACLIVGGLVLMNVR
jgi:drug/metabolite transporter (DMT)-like permease